MKVFKFGGASVKDADAVKNVARILRLYVDDLIVVVSAMGKTTNAMEGIVDLFFNQKDYAEDLKTVRQFHDEIVTALDLVTDEDFMTLYQGVFQKLDEQLDREPTTNFDFEYDQLVSFGEVLSTTIISGYLNAIGVANTWLDARKIIRTDTTYREGKVDWELTQALFQSKTGLLYQESTRQNIGIIQGFLGHTDTGQTTTLGREGSDFTAAIAAWCMDADDVTIWKDVPGVLNADPKFFNNTQKLDKISYREAIELSYYGASVIHPKTIKPLQNKAMPLFVKSFLAPEKEGTMIQSNLDYDEMVPSYIFREDQLLLSISPKDFSFIAEENMRDIFELFGKHRVKVNLMQNSAISFSICANNDPLKVPGLMDDLNENYKVKYNLNLELMTIRNYNDTVIRQLTENRITLVEQRSRQTVRFVVEKEIEIVE